MSDAILDFINDLFYGPFFSLAQAVWNWSIGICTGIMGNSPEEFSSGAWTYVKDDLYPWALGIGVSMTNLFFIIGFFRAASNLKENITLELCVETLIRLVVLNVLLQTGFEMIRTLFRAASLLAVDVMQMEDIPFYTTDSDIGAHLFWWIFGFGYFVVALVCGIMIMLTLFGRYVKLYLLIIFYPLAMPTVAGGRGIDSSAHAWLKSFISNAFEIVVIAMVMSISGMLIAGITVPELPAVEFFDGGAQALFSMVSMILMTVSVKSSSAFLNRTLAL